MSVVPGERLLLVAVPEGVVLLDNARTGADKSNVERLANLLQVLFQFAREIDQGELSVVHFGLQHPVRTSSTLAAAASNLSISSPRFAGQSLTMGKHATPPPNALRGVNSPALSATSASSPSSGSITSPAGDPPRQSLVAKRIDGGGGGGVLCALIYRSLAEPSAAEMTAAVERVSQAYLKSPQFAALEQLRPTMKNYKNDTDEGRAVVDQQVAHIMAPFQEQQVVG